ncbi:hypothetical protein [Salinigranum marinum]|uniref:hypothetical protein n=1 Tax=Salinigranum marinum TaxID=1515595 RepID=UPI002989D7F6|nr:hypothetical protein [Salinigranum marinum]
MSDATGLCRPPDAVVAAARAAADDRDGAAAHVVVADPAADGDATLEDGRYEGPDAVACGHLAAALSVADATPGVRLHHGDVDLTAEGAWLVLAPLDGLIATVATGTATATVTVPIDEPARIRPVRARLDAVLAAARARHDHYPVADDERGVFRTGMTTFSFRETIRESGLLRVRFDVSTTPATTRSEVTERFASLAISDPGDGDETSAFEPSGVDVTFEAGVERADPSVDVRDAVETAHRAVVGDAGYEWLARPTVFSRLPSAEKVAFGGGRPGDRFDGDDFERTRALLERVTERVSGREGRA